MKDTLREFYNKTVTSNKVMKDTIREYNNKTVTSNKVMNDTIRECYNKTVTSLLNKNLFVYCRPQSKPRIYMSTTLQVNLPR